MRGNIVLKLIYLIIFLNIYGTAKASDRAYGWSNVCVADENNPKTSLSPLLHGLDDGLNEVRPIGLKRQFTKDVINSKSVKSVIANYKVKRTSIEHNTISTPIFTNSRVIVNFADLFYFSEELIDAAAYKYLSNSPNELKSILDYWYELNFESGFVDQLNQAFVSTSNDQRVTRYLTGSINYRINGISSAAQLYYQHWQLTGEQDSLVRAVYIFNRLRDFLVVNKKYLTFQYGHVLPQNHVVAIEVYPTSLEYMNWQYSGYLEIAKMQLAVVNDNKAELKSSLSDFKILSTKVARDLDNAILKLDQEFIDSSWPFSSKGKLINNDGDLVLVDPKEDVAGAYKYLLFGKAQRELLYQNTLVSSLEASANQNIDQLNRLVGNLSEQYNFMISYGYEESCDEMFLARLDILGGEIFNNIFSIAKDVADENQEQGSNNILSGAMYSASGYYRRSLSRIKYEYSKVFWCRAINGAQYSERLLIEELRTENESANSLIIRDRTMRLKILNDLILGACYNG